MSYLKQVVKGKLQRPKIITIYGPDGIGKSTFAAQAPSPIFLGAEDGTASLDVTRFPQFESWKQVMSALDELLKEDHAYKTLVVDSLDWLEPMLYKEICGEYGVNSIEKAAGGYGKGFIESVNKWREFTRMLTSIRDKRGMHIILIAHAEIVRASDPMHQTEFDRFQLKLYKKSAALIREFCEAVLFATHEVFTKKDGTRTRAFGDGVRVMYTEWRPGFEAKNRYSLPLQMPLDWQEFERACDAGGTYTPASLREDIVELAKAIKADDTRQKIMETTEKAGVDIQKLQQIKNRILVILEQASDAS